MPTALAGCFVQADDSCERSTDTISVVAHVVDNGTDVRAEIDLDGSDRSSFPDPLELCEDDRLRIGGRAPKRTDRIDRVVYSVNFPLADAPRELEFEFDREEHDSVAFTIALPPAFVILTPQPTEAVPRGADYLMTWDPPNVGARMRIDITEKIGDGVCIDTPVDEHDYKSLGGVDVDDGGRWTVPANTLDSPIGGDCDAVYELTRFGDAPYPDAFSSGGYLESRVERAVPFVSTP